MNFIPNLTSNWLISGMGFLFIWQCNNSDRDDGSQSFETLCYVVHHSDFNFPKLFPFLLLERFYFKQKLWVPSRLHTHWFGNPYTECMILNCVHYCILYSQQLDRWSPAKLATKSGWLRTTQIAYHFQILVAR